MSDFVEELQTLHPWPDATMDLEQLCLYDVGSIVDVRNSTEYVTVPSVLRFG